MRDTSVAGWSDVVSLSSSPQHEDIYWSACDITLFRFICHHMTLYLQPEIQILDAGIPAPSVLIRPGQDRDCSARQACAVFQTSWMPQSSSLREVRISSSSITGSCVGRLRRLFVCQQQLWTQQSIVDSIHRAHPTQTPSQSTSSPRNKALFFHVACGRILSSNLNGQLLSRSIAVQWANVARRTRCVSWMPRRWSWRSFSTKKFQIMPFFLILGAKMKLHFETSIRF